MATKESIQEQLDFLTTTLSTQTRTTAFGALAVSWGLLISDSPVARSVAGLLKWHLVAVGAVAILTMSLDFGQYLAGYKNVKNLYDKLEATKKDEGDYDYRSGLYRLRTFLFSAKIVCLILTVAWLLGILVSWLVRSD